MCTRAFYYGFINHSMPHSSNSEQCISGDTQDVVVELSAVREQLKQLERKYTSLQEHTSLLAALATTASDMMKQDSLDNLLQLIANEIVSLTNANGAYMHMVHETEDYLLVVASCGKLEDQLMGNTRKRGFGLSAQAWDTGKFQYTDSYNHNFNQVVVFPEELKAVAIPLSFSGKISGVAFVTSSVSEDLLSQVPLLEEIAKIASLAIYYTEQLESQTKELQRTKSLSLLGDTLYQSTDWDTILHNVSAHLFEIFDIDCVSVYQESEIEGQLVTHARHTKVGNDIQTNNVSIETLSKHSISYWCFNNNKFAQVNRNVKDRRESSQVHKYREANDVGSTMCIPISYQEKPWGVLVIYRHVNKRNFNENDSNALHSVASQLSTAMQRNSLLSKVQFQAFHDSLTRLPNRRSFEQYFADSIKSDAKSEYAVLFCDLDGFKDINDTHGHDVGDAVLNICAERMRSCIDDDSSLSRMGGDEFALLLKLTDSAKTIDLIANDFIDILSDAIQTNNLRLHLGVSIGISLYPKDGTTFSELLNHADVAMYQAKHGSKGKVQYFNKKDAEEIRDKNEMRAELPLALARREFELWYQPQVCWESLRVTGVEALVRWNHPKSGMVPPFKFIPIAEESGFIDPLGMWIMEEAIAKLATGALSTNSELNMGVNIATPQFLDPDFSSKVLALLKKYNVEPCLLKVEITESFIMNDRETVVMHLKNLRDNGVLVAIDDFGTGYSSLSYLQDLPVDILKIDRSFVTRLTEDNFDKSIAASIIALANSLGLATIVEGVETEEQLGFIKQIGCDLIQGYYYSKPVSADELPGIIEQIEHSNCLPLKKSA